MARVYLAVVIVCLSVQSLFPLVIVTRKFTDPSMKVRPDFSLTSEMIDTVFDVVDDFTLNTYVKPNEPVPVTPALSTQPQKEVKKIIKTKEQKIQIKENRPIFFVSLDPNELIDVIANGDYKKLFDFTEPAQQLPTVFHVALPQESLNISRILTDTVSEENYKKLFSEATQDVPSGLSPQQKNKNAQKSAETDGKSFDAPLSYTDVPAASYNDEYKKLFFDTVNSPSNSNEHLTGDFNLFSRESSQLTYLPSDFNLSTDIFDMNPQFTTVVDYYVNDHYMTVGERFVVTDDTFRVTVVRKSQPSSSRGNIPTRPTEYTITCPGDYRVEWDVTEFDLIPSYLANTRAKGCVITISPTPYWYT